MLLTLQRQLTYLSIVCLSLPNPVKWDVPKLKVVPDLLITLLSLGMQWHLARWASQTWPKVKQLHPWLWTGARMLGAGLALMGYLLAFHRTWRYLPSTPASLLQACCMILNVLLVGVYLSLLSLRNLPAEPSPRRQFLKTTGTALAVAPIVGVAFGIISRDQFELNEVKVVIPNLPKDLHGLRLVQISDIHLSPFLSERQFARAIDMANEAKAHVALVTGDLITRDGDPLDACLRQLARLRAEAGVLGCLGNHEVYTRTEAYVASEGQRIGVDFLRSRARSLRFGDARINFGGVDYQPMRTKYLWEAEKLIVPGEVNVLLSHNPDVFQVAAAQGFDLILAGHTHGGQVNFEILHRNVNVALAFTPYVRGLYTQGNSSIYVSSGLGTIGVPVRVGAPPEVSLIQLCAV